jgi:hypothetical protein
MQTDLSRFAIIERRGYPFIAARGKRIEPL